MMKKTNFFLSLVGFFLISLTTSAQMVIWVDSIQKHEVYAGALATIRYTPDDQKVSVLPNFRFGSRSTINLNQGFSLTGFLIGEIDNGVNFSYTHMYGKYSKNNFTVIAGYGATPCTEIRPIPMEGNAQFEPVSIARIPGAEPLVKVAYEKNHFRVAGSVGLKENEADYQLGLKLNNNIRLGGHYRKSFYGACAEIKAGDFYQVLLYDNTKVLAGLTALHEGSANLDFYIDWAFPTYKGKPVRLELGVLKNFQGERLSGLFGLGYAQEVKGFKAYYFLHI